MTLPILTNAASGTDGRYRSFSLFKMAKKYTYTRPRSFHWVLSDTTVIESNSRGSGPQMAFSNSPSRRSGFSLIVVLSALMILTLIFGIASAGLVGHIQRDEAARQLALKDHAAMQKMVAVLVAGHDVYGIDHPNLDGLTLQPASGLVDLNTASPALMRMFLEGYGLPRGEIDDALVQYYAWRRSDRKLLRVSEFPLVAGIDPVRLPDLRLLSTVYSGRTGLDIAQVPSNLAWHLLETEPGGLADKLDPSLVSAGSVTNLHVLDAGVLLGVVHLGGEVQLRRILELH